MVLAAGLGTRMRPLTLSKPKPLFTVGDRTMLDHALDKLVGVGVQKVVVNTYYLAEQIEEHLQGRKDLEIIISRETELLETGGGIKNALRYFDHQPFFILNADLPWMDSNVPSLSRMKATWDPDLMDTLLLVMPTRKARGFDLTKGDFMIDPLGHLLRKNVPLPRPYVFISAQIMKPELFEGVQEKIFSSNLIWNRLEDKKRLFGLPHDGTCYHVGTPEDWEKANSLLKSGRGWAVDD